MVHSVPDGAAIVFVSMPMFSISTSIRSPGTIALAHRGRIEVACGEGRVEIVRAQVEGKKALGAAELVGGRAITEGAVLGATS